MRGIATWHAAAAWLLCLSLFATDATGAQEPAGTAPSIPPAQAVMLAADDPARGVTGVFEFEVRGAGRDRQFIYLNSEKDYRDQRCLTIRLTRGNAVALGDRLGVPVRDGLVGKRIRVHGTARRVRINIHGHGKPTGLHYYQTHVYVDDPTQIQLLEGS